MSAHGQAGIVAFVGGLAVIEAETLAKAALILGAAAVIAAVILIAGKIQ